MIAVASSNVIGDSAIPTSFAPALPMSVWTSLKGGKSPVVLSVSLHELARKLGNRHMLKLYNRNSSLEYIKVRMDQNRR